MHSQAFNSISIAFPLLCIALSYVFFSLGLGGLIWAERGFPWDLRGSGCRLGCVYTLGCQVASIAFWGIFPFLESGNPLVGGSERISRKGVDEWAGVCSFISSKAKTAEHKTQRKRRMKTIHYKYPVLTKLERLCEQLDFMSCDRFCRENSVSERVASAAFGRLCEKRREIALWEAREKDGRPHFFTVP